MIHMPSEIWKQSNSFLDNKAQGLTDLVKPFTLEQSCNPIYNSIHHTRYCTVNDDGSCDFEHIGGDPEDESLCLEFYGG